MLVLKVMTLQLTGLLSLLASRGLPLRGKCILYSVFVCSVVLYGIETWPVTEEAMIRLVRIEEYGIRLKRNDRRMFRWMCNIRLEDRVSAEDLMARPKLLSMRECLQDKYYNGFIIWKEWKGMHVLINIEPSKLVVVSPEDDLRKHGVRSSKK